MPTFYNPSAKANIEISNDGGTNYYGLRNITNFSFSGGDKTESTVETIDGDPVVSVGNAQPKDITIDLNANPASEGYRIAFNGYKNNKSVQIRVKTEATQVEDNSTAGKTLALAATGVVTGVQTKFQTDPKWQQLRGIVLSNSLYIIENITTDTSMQVSKADGGNIAQVAASSDWEIWKFGVQWVFEAEVLSAGNVNLTAGGDGYQDSLTLKGVGVIPDPTFIFTTP